MQASEGAAGPEESDVVARRATGFVPKRSRGVIWSFCVFGPVAVLLIELMTRMCAGAFFDPIPTWFHVLVLLAIPITAHKLFTELERGIRASRVRVFSVALGACAAVAGFYCLLFLLLIPLALMAIALVGLGLLPLTPYFAGMGLMWLARRLHGQALELREPFLRPFLLGVMLVLGILGAVEIPAQVTGALVKQALRGGGQEQLIAIRRLRWMSSKDLLNRVCRTGQFQRTRIGSRQFERAFGGVTYSKMDRLYFRVTGDRVRPTLETSTWMAVHDSSPYNWAESVAGTDWGTPTSDAAWGTQLMGPMQPSLSLRSSRIEGSIDAQAAVGYAEWTMEFEASGGSVEARALLRLPRGGVVSKLSLWIDNQERPAAFGGRSQVSQAYESVVRARKDPVVVTTVGIDHVLLRCFPVTKHAPMRVRVGITFPLEALEPAGDPRQRVFELPMLRGHNFTVDQEHDIELKSNVSLETEAGEQLTGRSDGLEGTYASHSRVHRSMEVQCTAEAPLSLILAENYLEPGQSVRQEFVEHFDPAPQSLVLVIDGSRAMGGFRQQCLEWLQSLDGSLPVQLLIPSDEGTLRFSGREEAIQGLVDFTFEGGINNRNALELAWQIASESDRAPVYWLSTRQPVNFGREQLKGWSTYDPSQPDSPRLIGCCLDGTTNPLLDLVVEQAPGAVRLVRPAVLLAEFEGMHKPRREWIRRLTMEPDGPGTEPVESDHVVRLWAAGEVQRLRVAQEKDAQALAVAYHLVTPVSGAVVLENKRQYDANDLTPDGTERVVPTVPEPGEWLLLAVALGVLFVEGRRRSGPATS